MSKDANKHRLGVVTYRPSGRLRSSTCNYRASSACEFVVRYERKPKGIVGVPSLAPRPPPIIVDYSFFSRVTRLRLGS
jgi:hypothetical protein